jgi:long-chain acyl-CoA synthetase
MKSRRGSEIVKLFKRERITVLLTVPALLVVFKNKIEEKARSAGSLKTLRKLLGYADRMPLGLRRLVFGKVHKSFGGRLTRIVVGGAHLVEEVEVFWERLGFKVVKGYGLTETSPIISATPEDDRVVGSVGPTIPGVEMKFTDEKEICVRGRNVFRGYYSGFRVQGLGNSRNNRKKAGKRLKGEHEVRPYEVDEEKTSEVFDGDWFKTGDIGELDDRGFLFLKGRVKNMILSDSGLNVYPEDIERFVNKLSFVRECVVLGLSKKEKTVITAVLLLTDDFKEKFGKREQKSCIKERIDRINNKLEVHQRIQDFVVWEHADFPRTLTFKAKRGEIEKELAGRGGDGKDYDDQLVSILSSLSHVDGGKIEDKMLLFSDLGFDSLRVLELAVKIEEKMRVEIEEHRINKETTVRVLRDFIEQAKKRQVVKKELPVSMFWRVWQPVRWMLFKLGAELIKLFVVNLRIEGYENVRTLKSPVIVTPNHTSHFDILTVLDHLPDKMRVRMASGGAADYFFKADSWRSRLLTWAMFHLGGAFPIVRNEKVKHFTLKQSMDFVGEIVDMGWSLFVFPEGTRTMTGKMNAFQQGIGLIVKETGLPVVPVKIDGFCEILPKGSIFPKRCAAVTIKYGEAIEFGKDLSAEEITSRLERVVRRM